MKAQKKNNNNIIILFHSIGQCLQFIMNHVCSIVIRMIGIFFASEIFVLFTCQHKVAVNYIILIMYAWILKVSQFFFIVLWKVLDCFFVYADDILYSCLIKVLQDLIDSILYMYILLVIMRFCESMKWELLKTMGFFFFKTKVGCGDPDTRVDW